MANENEELGNALEEVAVDSALEGLDNVGAGLDDIAMAENLGDASQLMAAAAASDITRGVDAEIVAARAAVLSDAVGDAGEHHREHHPPAADLSNAVDALQLAPEQRRRALALFPAGAMVAIMLLVVSALAPTDPAAFDFEAAQSEFDRLVRVGAQAVSADEADESLGQAAERAEQPETGFTSRFADRWSGGRGRDPTGS